MIDVLFIQGASAGAHAADTRLAASLAEHLGANYSVHFPRMPDETEPTYSAWAATLSKELAAAASPCILVAHSIGASFVLRYLSMNDIDPSPLGVFLASPPFVGEHGWPYADFELPAQAGRKLRNMKLFFFQGKADDTVPAAHADLYEKAFPHAKMRRLPGRDHQLNDDLHEIAAAIHRECPAS